MGKVIDIANESSRQVSMKKMNCWEHKKCGRQPGGHKTEELGVCPAAVHDGLDGAHGGQNAGRACWAIAGSLCGGKVQGTYAKKLLNCWRCDFMNQVKREEEPETLGFSHTRLGMERSLDRRHLHETSSVHTGEEQPESKLR
jgi:hypothetical protein